MSVASTVAMPIGATAATVLPTARSLPAATVMAAAVHATTVRLTAAGATVPSGVLAGVTVSVRPAGSGRLVRVQQRVARAELSRVPRRSSRSVRRSSVAASWRVTGRRLSLRLAAMSRGSFCTGRHRRSCSVVVVSQDATPEAPWLTEVWDVTTHAVRSSYDLLLTYAVLTPR